MDGQEMTLVTLFIKKRIRSETGTGMKTGVLRGNPEVKKVMESEGQGSPSADHVSFCFEGTSFQDLLNLGVKEPGLFHECPRQSL